MHECINSKHTGDSCDNYSWLIFIFMMRFIAFCLGSEDYKCPITCEVMRDPVVASGNCARTVPPPID